MDDIMKIIKFLEGSGLLIKGICKAIKGWNKRKNRWIFLHVIRVTSGASLLGKLLKDKGVIRAGERPIRAGQNF